MVSSSPPPPMYGFGGRIPDRPLEGVPSRSPFGLFRRWPVERPSAPSRRSLGSIGPVWRDTDVSSTLRIPTNRIWVCSRPIPPHAVRPPRVHSIQSIRHYTSRHSGHTSHSMVSLSALPVVDVSSQHLADKRHIAGHVFVVWNPALCVYAVRLVHKSQCVS